MDIRLIQNRRGEVESLITKYKSEIDQLEKELVDLNTAERVIASLSGAKGQSASKENKSDEEASAKPKPEGIPTVRQMILEALTQSETRWGKGMLPRDITTYIHSNYWPEMNPNQVYSNISRMLNELQEVVRDDDTGIYRVRENEKPVDEEVKQTASTGLFFNTLRGREADPGGGT